MNKVSRFLSRARGFIVAVQLLILPAQADSLWHEDGATSMVADKKAHAVGDIITILVQESNSAQKDNSTKTAKSSGVDASISSFLYGPAASKLLTKGGTLPALKFDSKNTFDGGGQINNSETITARIAVRVIDVLPNKTMIIEGKKLTSFSGEKQEAILRGVLRSEDLAANNTIFSYNIADATIQFVAKGSVSDSQNKGWFTKIWDKVSPF
ncbi:MAG: flagellar L-ring protein [Verrucomicrobiales bacterium]|nr:flagellar L-ring protein [Verrucomicrobiales bacterium]MDB6131175.1 flagellar L-ring protein [Verrucomicrobiales bacterium]